MLTPAGDVNYERTGTGYAQMRRADPRIAAQIHAALASSRTILNIGAGAGSYEPPGKHVIAIEPSRAMREQRPQSLAPAIIARAEELPLDDASVDASMATLTVHQWSDRAKGLAELVRVTRGPIVVMTFDPAEFQRFWIAEYAPAYVASERTRDVPLSELTRSLSANSRSVRVEPVAIPIDCTDGFVEAYYARPEKFLDAAVTRAQSGWNFTPPGTLEAFRTSLAAALTSGAWDAKHAHLRSLPTYQGSLRLVISVPS